MAIPFIDGTSGAWLLLKPAYGLPCNGCGYCCVEEPCAIALEHIPDHPREGACVALEREGDRFVSGMIRRPSPYMQLPNDWTDVHLGRIFAAALGAGRGCDADDPEPSLTLRA